MGEPDTAVIRYRNGTTETFREGSYAVSIVGIGVGTEQESRIIPWAEIAELEAYDSNGDLVAWWPPRSP